MKKILVGVLALFFLGACADKKGKNETIIVIQTADSNLCDIDSLQIDDCVESPRLVKVNELFDDFIYNFASDPSLQLERISFPLPYNDNGTVSEIEEHTWVHDDLFTDQEYYTLLFDREEDIELVGDTSLTSVQVEWIYLNTQQVKNYFFTKNNGAWQLDSLDLSPIVSTDKENFAAFFAQFAVDTTFQTSRIVDPLIFVTADPDDDFSIIQASLDLEQWFAFKPDLPVDKLSNINYGQRSSDSSNKKILALKGMENGFSNILYFKRKSKASSWEMYKFEDVSI